MNDENYLTLEPFAKLSTEKYKGITPTMLILNKTSGIGCIHFHIVMMMVGGQRSMGMRCLRDKNWNKD
jgi:hypothetical protein